MADLSLEFCGVKFPDPFTLAAAPPTDSGEMIKRAFDAGWNSAVCKTIAMEKEEVSLVYPMMHSLSFEGRKVMGLENIDLISERHIDKWLPEIVDIKKNFPHKVLIASIMASSKEDWQSLVKMLEQAGIDMIECSFSCPHGMPERGMGSTIGQNPELTERTARWVKEAAARVPVIIKLTPNITDITASAKAVKRSGADGVCAINTVKGLIGIDLDTFTPYPNVDGKSTYGGYSGAAIKPIALKCISEIAKAVDIPISGVGGVWSWRDAAEFLLAGAGNVQLCTAVMAQGFRIINDLKEGLSDYLDEKGLAIDQLIGKALPNITTHEGLSRKHKVRAWIDPDICIKCDLCYNACMDGAHQAIKLNGNRLPEVDPDKCVGCGFCPSVCPADCITLKKI